MAHDQRKSLNPTNVKKRLKDYEQMLQYYTLMGIENKMKDSKVEYRMVGGCRGILYKGV
jgi:hypothetical protein